jgi:hypothetical protein
MEGHIKITPMHIRLEIISPAIAKEMLASNTLTNRSISQNNVNSLAEEMKSGRWKVNGDTIRFSKKNELIDGQHRLLAVIKSGVTIETFVLRGVEAESFDTIDQGKNRTAKDVFSIRQEKNCALLAATIGLVNRYLSGTIHLHKGFSPGKLEELLEEHPGIRESVNHMPKTRGLVAGSILAACHYLFSRKDQEAADEFIKTLISGAGLNEDDPRHVLREKLIKNSLSIHRFDSEYSFALIIKAWNAWRGKKVIRILSFGQDTEPKEVFPIIK